jgi:hypothetical protein
MDGAKGRKLGIGVDDGRVEGEGFFLKKLSAEKERREGGGWMELLKEDEARLEEREEEDEANEAMDLNAVGFLWSIIASLVGLTTGQELSDGGRGVSASC